MLYFIYRTYDPNTAPTNRALAFVRSIERNKVSISLVFFLPNATKSRIKEVFRYVTVRYYWDRGYLNHRLLKYISYWFYLKHFLRKLKKGDKVFIGGDDDLLKSVLSKRGIQVYYEKTESPEVFLSGSRLFSPTLAEHINLCKRVDNLFVISSMLRHYYIAHGIDERRIHVINMTVDTERFSNMKRNSADKYIAYCGTISNNKDGVDDLLKAFAIVSNIHTDIRLYIIGAVQKKQDALENLKLIKDLRIQDKVIFTGRVAASDMPQILMNAQILALARPDNEQAKYGFPTKLGEYLMTGNPVVVTSVGDIPLFLHDGVTALIAQPSNPQLFADKLNWAIDNAEKAREIGRNGQEVAMQSFNASIEADKLLHVIFDK